MDSDIDKFIGEWEDESGNRLIIRKKTEENEEGSQVRDKPMKSKEYIQTLILKALRKLGIFLFFNFSLKTVEKMILKIGFKPSSSLFSTMTGA